MSTGFEVVSALPTPFDESGLVDEGTWSRLLDHVAPWSDGVLVAGTTGEFLTLTATERQRLTTIALAELGAARVVVHIGAASLRQVTELAEAAVDAGATRLAVLTPYFHPYERTEVADFLGAVREATTGAMLYGYFFAERTGVDLEVDDVAELIDSCALDGVKISGELWHEVPGLRQQTAPELPILTGHDADPWACVALGATGVASGLSSVDPELYHRLARVPVTEREELTAAVTALSDRVDGSLGRLKREVAARVPAPWCSRIPLTGEPVLQG